MLTHLRNRRVSANIDLVMADIDPGLGKIPFVMANLRSGLGESPLVIANLRSGPEKGRPVVSYIWSGLSARPLVNDHLKVNEGHNVNAHH